MRDPLRDTFDQHLGRVVHGLQSAGAAGTVVLSSGAQLEAPTASRRIVEDDANASFLAGSVRAGEFDLKIAWSLVCGPMARSASALSRSTDGTRRRSTANSG